MELNVNGLKELPKKNQTSFLVLKDNSQRERIRRETDIDRYQMQLLNKGHKVDPNEYLQVWKDLETLGAGVVIWGRNGNPNRFRWHYSLKDISSEALSPDAAKTPIVPLSEESPSQMASKTPKRQYKKRSKRGRPVGSKNKTKAVFPFSKPVGSVSGSISGIILTVTGVDGKPHAIALEEAVRISEQVLKLKELKVA